MARILMVDDSETIRLTLGHKLTEAGYQVSSYKSGLKAIQAITEQSFDFFLIDIILGDISGFEVVEHIRQTSHNKNAPIIMLTGSPTPENLQKALNMSVACILAKPFSFELLHNKIQQILKPPQTKLVTLDPTIIHTFLNATLFVFSNFAGIQLEAGKPSLKNTDSAVHDYSAVISFVNPHVRGTVAINIDGEVLIRVLQFLFRNVEGFVIDHAALCDCCGELANQVLGKAKALFIKERKFNFEISVPTVIHGKNHILNYKSSASILVIPFKTDKNTIYVEFCVEENTGETTENVDVSIVSEGELLLF